MAEASLPPEESERLRTLRLYRVLDTAAQKAYDELTHLAAKLCDTPIGLVSLVDERRQWFKSRVGLEAQETPREMAFCAHAILQDGPLIVEDALADPRFADNPLVTSDPNIRFYAGAPLRMPSGHALGTLCVIDRQPRGLTDQQLEALLALAHAVEAQLELQRALQDLASLQRVVPMCAWCRTSIGRMGAGCR
jgi:GAF domain-containing protein